MSKESKSIKFNRREGFWNSGESPDLPMLKVHAGVWPEKKLFLDALTKVETSFVPLHFKGYSRCRICGCSNGSAEYQSVQGWSWPSGFKHYVVDHGIKPSVDFEIFIRNYDIDLAADIYEEGKKAW